MKRYALDYSVCYHRLRVYLNWNLNYFPHYEELAQTTSQIDLI